MNLDKLKALIRLANNNPNENEANLAARKVCKQLTESDIEKLNNSPRTAYGKVGEAALKEWMDARTGDMHIVITQLDLHNSANNRVVELLKRLKNEIERPKTWNDVKRSTEPEFGSRAYSVNSDINYFFRRHGVHFSGFDWSKVEYKYAPEEPMDPPRRNKEEDFDWIQGKRKRKQEFRICSRCGLKTMTFRTDEVPWICNPCHWKENK